MEGRTLNLITLCQRRTKAERQYQSYKQKNDEIEIPTNNYINSINSSKCDTSSFSLICIKMTFVVVYFLKNLFSSKNSI